MEHESLDVLHSKLHLSTEAPRGGHPLSACNRLSKSKPRPVSTVIGQQDGLGQCLSQYKNSVYIHPVSSLFCPARWDREPYIRKMHLPLIA
jgi:hypothetical protein